MHHGVALTDPSNYSSPFVLVLPPPLPALRRYDITGIGINLWLIHLHFIPREPRHLRRGARTSTRTNRNAHKHRQNLPSSPLLISSGSLFAVLPRDGSNPISSSIPPLSLSSRHPRPFHLLYRDSNSGLIEGFVRWRIASYPGTFCGLHNISRLLSYFRYSQSILYHEVMALLTTKKYP